MPGVMRESTASAFSAVLLSMSPVMIRHPSSVRSVVQITRPIVGEGLETAAAEVRLAKSSPLSATVLENQQQDRKRGPPAAQRWSFVGSSHSRPGGVDVCGMRGGVNLWTGL